MRTITGLHKTTFSSRRVSGPGWNRGGYQKVVPPITLQSQDLGAKVGTDSKLPPPHFVLRAKREAFCAQNGKRFPRQTGIRLTPQNIVNNRVWLKNRGDGLRAKRLPRLARQTGSVLRAKRSPRLSVSRVKRWVTFGVRLARKTGSVFRTKREAFCVPNGNSLDAAKHSKY